MVEQDVYTKVLSTILNEFVSDGEYMIMFNPEIIKQSDPYDTEEGCLSLLGGPRKCKRYKKTV